MPMLDCIGFPFFFLCYFTHDGMFLYGLFLGIKKALGTGDISTESLLQVSNMKKEFRICMLSDADFSEVKYVSESLLT